MVDTPPLADEPAMPPWENEPATLDKLLEEYIVENKFSAAVPGGILCLTNSATRDNKTFGTEPGQRFKLWLVAWRNTFM